jgi:hypothetical protein
MVAGRLVMMDKGLTKQMPGQQTRHRGNPAQQRERPIQVMVPESVRRQVALMSAERGESIRTLVLRGLQAVGIKIPESELADRRGRRRSLKGDGNGAK